jgi:hypothetical protein
MKPLNVTALILCSIASALNVALGHFGLAALQLAFAIVNGYVVYRQVSR